MLGTKRCFVKTHHWATGFIFLCLILEHMQLQVDRQFVTAWNSGIIHKFFVDFVLPNLLFDLMIKNHIKVFKLLD